MTAVGPNINAGLRYVVERRLGLSANLVRLADGRPMVQRTSRTPEHLAETIAANRMYRAAGVKVPDQIVVRDAKGTPIETLDEWIEGTPLPDLDGSARVDALRRTREGFAADALVANWDAVLNDNVIVTASGAPVRADLGGSLRYRARREQLKGAAFGDEVAELTSLRDPNFAGSHAVFGALTDADVGAQILRLLRRREAVIEAAPTDLRPQIARRMQYMERWASDAAAG